MPRTFLFTSILSLSGLLYGQDTIELSRKDEITLDSVASAYLQTTQSPGVAVGVLKNGKVLYSKGLGVKDLRTKEPMTSQTVFHMASVSKPFVSTAIMILVEQGKLDLSDPVTKHLPYFKMKDPRYTNITVEHLLLHTAGIPDVGPSANYEWDNPQFGEDALENHVRSLQSLKLDFKPGRKKPSYTNNGYEVLGDIVSKASGMSFEEFMKKYLLGPNDMSSSSFLLKDIPTESLSSPHVKNAQGSIVVSEVYPYNRKHAPSSCLHASLEDMLKFALTNMNKGVYEETRIFSAASHELLIKPRVRQNKIFQYGLGWNIAPYRNTQRIEFTGGDVGFDTVIIMVPSVDFAIVVLTNRDFPPPAFGVINTAFDIAMRYKE